MTAAHTWADVLSVRADDRQGGAALTIGLTQKPVFRVFTLENPARVVVDLAQSRWRAGALSGATLAVANLRHGQFTPDVYRLVFDLAEPSSIAGSRLVEADRGVRLEIELAHLTPAAATAPDAAAIPLPPFRPAERKLFATASLAKATSARPAPPPAEPASPRPATVAARADPGARIERFLPSPPRRPTTRTIVIDAGHGGVDPGARGQGGVVEKRVNLAVAKAIQRNLELRPGYEVVLTRGTDRFVRLRERVDRGRAANADLFISIHADSHPDSSVRGASLYTLSETASDREAARLARSENKADLIGGVALEQEQLEIVGILLDLAQRETQNKSSAAADDLLFALAATQPLLTTPKRSAGFAVLKAPDVPSVLIELGFLSNPDDARRLGDKASRDNLARAISEGVVRFFDGANVARAQAQLPPG